MFVTFPGDRQHQRLNLHNEDKTRICIFLVSFPVLFEGLLSSSAPRFRPETPTPPTQTHRSFRSVARVRICRSSPISLLQFPPRSVRPKQSAATCPAFPIQPVLAS